VTDWDDTTNVADPTALLAAGEAEQRDRAYLIVIAGSSIGEMFKLKGDEMILGRGASADIRLVDDGVSRLHCRVKLGPEGVVVEDLRSRNGTFCNGERIAAQVLADGDKLQLGRTTILRFTYHDKLDESFQRQLLDSALRDGLTRSFNKRYFLERLNSEFRFAQRHRSHLSLLLLDLDHFKQLNDTHGHVAGDKVLIAFAEHIHKSIRNEDVFARYGGEEFAVISRAISRNDAQRFAERLRQGIEMLRVDFEGRTLTVTASIGIATLPEDPCEGAQDLISTADRALYAAKAAGRNRVEISALSFGEEGTKP
jgi:two-component system, cell cycle response regulator